MCETGRSRVHRKLSLTYFGFRVFWWNFLLLPQVVVVTVKCTRANKRLFIQLFCLSLCLCYLFHTVYFRILARPVWGTVSRTISSWWNNQAVQRSNLNLPLALFDLGTFPSWGGVIHSSMYLFGDREQLERLASRHPSALDSVLNWSCPAHHHRTTAYQDTEMTCNMSPDSRRGG